MRPKPIRMISRAAMMLLMMVLTATTAWAELAPVTVDDYTFTTGSDDDGEYYVVNSEDAFQKLAAYVEGGGTTSDKRFKMTNNISVSETMVGTSGNPFKGTFDGNHKTLTLNYGNVQAPIDAEFVAPFVEVSGGATFINLNIDGHIYAAYTGSSESGVGGLIGHLFGGINIEGCTSTVEINSTKDRVGGFVGLCEHAVTFTDCKSSAVVTCTGSGSGFVGWSRASEYTIAFYGCLFNGKVLKKNGVGSGNGGFVGWKGYHKTVKITNCLVDPAAVAEGETMADDNSATFCRYSADTSLDNQATSITNCYYTETFGNAQGTQAYSISKGEYVTTLEINGTATQSYDVSGLGFYSTGIKCGDVLYAVANAQLDLTLANNANPPLGYQYDYTVTGGATLNGNTLTMAHDDVTVSVDTESGLHSTGQPVSVTYMNADGTTSSHNAIALDETMTTLAGGWYFVGKDIAYTGTITLNGDVTIILADGKTMSVGTSETPISGGAISGEISINWREYYDYALTVYGQSLANSTAGTLSLHTSSYGIEVKAYTQHSGNVSITSVYNSGIWTLGDAVTINGGHLDVNVGNIALFSYSDVIINGGIVNATGQVGGIRSSNNGNITLGWTNTSDYIYVNSYETTSTNAIASGQAFIDENNVVYSGTVNASDLNGKTLYPIDGCLPPSHLTATDIITTTATLTWTETGEATTWQICLNGDENNPITIDTEDVAINEGVITYQLTGLIPGTAYTVKVRANCDADDVSLWSNIATFTTLNPCEVLPSELAATNSTATTATLSWSGVQDSYNVRYRPAGGEDFNFFEGFEGCDNWTLPDGWTTVLEEDYGGWSACNNCYDIEAYNGNNYAIDYNRHAWLITPMMDLSGQSNVTLNFWYIDKGQLEVYYRINGGDWIQTPLWSSEGSHTQWTEATISLTENLSANYQIGFFISEGTPVFLDDIAITGTSLHPVGEWQTVNSIAATTTTLTGLTPETQYVWQVQGSNCDGEGSTTEWSEMGTFTTNSVLELADNDAEKPDGEKNADLISGDDGTAKDVMLAGRTLFKDGAWNTLCLPFDVTVGSGQMAGATAMTMNAAQSGFDSASGLLTLSFDGVGEGSTIAAGTPFIVKWTGNAGQFVENPMFSGVTIDLDSPSGAGGAITFNGTYNVMTFDAADPNVVLLEEGSNTLKYAASGDYLGACRAYFVVDPTAVGEGQTGARLTDYILHLGSLGLLEGSFNQRGDANGDGSISVTDIAVVVNCILQLTNNGGFSKYGADANGDGDITVTDIGVIVDLILGTSGNAASRRLTHDAPEPQ